jgi:hypothetical protein
MKSMTTLGDTTVVVEVGPGVLKVANAGTAAVTNAVVAN